MIMGAEIGMLLWGIMTLISGRLVLTGTRVVRGTPARLLALLAFLPLPLSFVVGLLVGMWHSAQGRAVTESSFRPIGAGIEAACLVLCLVALYAIGWRLAEPHEAAARSEGQKGQTADGPR